MNQAQFDHAVRVAGAVAGVDKIIAIGSQALYGSTKGPIPAAALRSVEADFAVPGDHDGSVADLIDGSIGEASMFHQTFGFYAQGMSIESAILPEGWEDRLVDYETPATNGVVAQCLSLEDLWVSKALAGRPKDTEFCRSLLKTTQLDREVLASRIDSADTHRAKKALAKDLIANTFGS